MATQTIGRYQIKSEIGRGGMATVYHAYDPNFERDVAIKVLPAAFLHDPQFRGRFEREAKMIALLEHPAIVPVYDFGEQEGQPYIVMRYMAGGSLADRLNKEALTYEDTTQLVSRLAPALDVAHQRGIIHRDLKPGNILFDQYGNSYLSDFGIARLVQSGVTTMTGESIVGTPAYMSPEQIQGDKSIDGRSDIYAMGVLIYQMLTGEAPYRADTPAKVMVMHILEPVPDLATAKTDLPKGCSSVIMRAMAKDPDERFSTTTELANALRGVTREIDTAPAQEDERTLFSSKTIVAAPVRATPVPTSVKGPPAASTQVAMPQPSAAPQARRAPIPLRLVVILAVLGIGALVLGGLYLMGRQGNGPLAMLASAPPTATTQPAPTSAPPTQTLASLPTTAAPLAILATDTPQPPVQQPTETPQPTSTWTPTPQPLAPVIAGADKIGFINAGDLYVANLDGSLLTQLTHDGAQKINLQWAPDGDSLVYISGKCVYRVSIEGESPETITCFNRSEGLKAFEISPNGAQVAVSLDNQMFIVPLDWASLAQAATRADLALLATCPEFAPFERNFITEVRWSADSTAVAAKLIGNLGDGRRGDIIQIFHVDQCIDNPRALDNFPPPRFEMRGFNKNPVVPSYAWDGGSLFALNNLMRNEGFGDLYIYNLELHKAQELVNPIDDSCCYRDMQWSPDGAHLLFAYQSVTDPDNLIQLYLIPVGTFGTGAHYEPLLLPAITNPREKPQPVLRPAR